MAKGWNQVDEELAAAKDRQERFDTQSGVPKLRLKHVKERDVVARYLEQGQDVNSFTQHIFKKPDSRATKTGYFEQLETCLGEINQECPACKAGIPTKIRGVYNLIYRNRPQFRKDKDGKAIKNPDGSYIIDGYADEVVVFECSMTSAGALRRADNDFRGLMSRDIKISFTGDNKNPFAFAVADIDAGAVPMSTEDLALAAKKYNLDDLFKPPTAVDMAKLVAQYGANSGASPNAATSPVPSTNQFLDGASLPAVADAGAFAAAQQPTPTPNQ